MALTMEILADRVRAAMEAAGMSQRALGQAIGFDPPTMSKALSGKRGFKPLELALISETLGISVQQLLADDGPTTREAVMARVQPEGSPATEQALARVRQMLELDGLLSEQGFAALPAVRPPRPSAGPPYQQGELLAQRLRSQSGLGDADLPTDLSQLAADVEDRFNVDVAIEPLERGLDGLAIWRRHYSLIMVSSSIAAHRQRYTMAHELGHLMAGDQGDIVDENINYSRTPAETRANAFAAAFLMPAGALRTATGENSTPTEELIADLLARYRVSLDALAFRLHNLGIIDAAGRDSVRRMSSTRIALRQGRASDLQARHDQRWPDGLLRRAVEAYARGRISIRPIAQLISVDPDALLEELAAPRLAPPGTTGTSESDDELVPML
ncbi:MAG: ImmA/IrrE family metallo-endopeptidase [Trebonia sp.]|jgi:Zn-dependent peptidase ImmA (M78 family)/transcriptional regulator with XRE-family HTH domain